MNVIMCQVLQVQPSKLTGCSGRKHQRGSGVRWRPGRLGLHRQKLLLGNLSWPKVHAKPGHRKSADGCRNSSGRLPAEVPSARLPPRSREYRVERDCSCDWADHHGCGTLDHSHVEGGNGYGFYKGENNNLT